MIAIALCTRTTFVYFFCSLLFSIPVQAESANDLNLLREAKLTHQSLLVGASHTSDGSTRAKNGKPRFVGPLGADVITFKGYQYTIYYTAQNRGGYGDLFAEVVVARRKIDGGGLIDGGDWEHSTLPVYRVTSRDAHNRASIAISKGDGVIHIAFDHHNLPRINYAHSALGVADNPSATQWNDQVFQFQRNLGFPNDALDRVTYPTFHQLPGGNLLMYFRNGGSTQGEMMLARYDAKQSEWKFIRRVTSMEGFYSKTVTDNNEPSFRGPYLTGGPKIDAGGRIHISWVFREKPVNCNPKGTNAGRDCNHGLYYAYSDDEGIKWYGSNNKLLADTSKGEAISVETQGAEVVHIPTTLMPSNVSLNSIVDDASGKYHVLIEHKTSAQGKSLLHHYVRDSDGKWTSSLFKFAASNVNMQILGNRMFAFAGRADAKIYYSTRQNGFDDWQEIMLPILDGEDSIINGGFVTWDLSQLASGKVSLSWHQMPADGVHGKPSAIFVYDFTVGE